jgi:hypothetical protein
MRKGLLVSILMLAGAGAAFAQAPAAGGVGHGPDHLPVLGPDHLPVLGPEDAHASAWTADAEGCATPCVWVGVDYLLWWIKDGHLPFPLVLSGPNDNINPGALNQNGFPVLTGRGIDYGTLSGVRVSAGGGFEADGRFGIEGNGFLLPQQSKIYRASSDANGNPVLGFRYFDTPFNSGSEDIFQASIPVGNPLAGPFFGGVAVVSNTRLWGAEVNGVVVLAPESGLHLLALAGFRYADLSEDLSLQLQSFAIGNTPLSFQGAPVPAPSGIATTDFFRTRNQFYGGQVGLRGESCLGNFVVAYTGKVALGDMHEVVEVQGTSSMIPNPGPITTVPNGQFAGPSNIGRRPNDEFAVIPEVEVKVGYQVTKWLRATVGYDFLYISRVARPGSQVDLVVNDSTNPVNAAFGVAPLDPTASPRPFFRKTDFWAQGLTFGLELEF